MARSVKAKQPSNGDTLPLFPELPPAPVSDLVLLRNLRRPVWTEQKAKLIARYLKLFTLVTKHGSYIDGFAGQQNARATEGWAAELVLANTPRWLRRFYLCDNDPKQIQALEALKARQPRKAKGESKRDIDILPGDFNQTVRHILSTKRLDPATFCLLDQRTFEAKWSTVTALAQHRPVAPKIELFYFLPIGWLDRAILSTTKNHAEIEAWWGRPDWRLLVDMQHHEKALAFKKRFEELGFQHVVPFPIFDHDNGDRIMFYMILASDHAAAPRLMWRAYDQAVHDVTGWDQIDWLA